LAVICAQPVEQFPAAGIGQGSEYLIHSHNMQPFGCLSSAKFVMGPYLAENDLPIALVNV
jgi:hypothetical protein